MYISKHISQYEPEMKKKIQESASKASVEVKLNLIFNLYMYTRDWLFVQNTDCSGYVGTYRERSKKTYYVLWFEMKSIMWFGK